MLNRRTYLQSHGNTQVQGRRKRETVPGTQRLLGDQWEFGRVLALKDSARRSPRGLPHAGGRICALQGLKCRSSLSG